MTIVNRWYNILEKMVSQPTYSLVDMRSELDISMQTLQKSIQQLNDVLAPSIQIISQDDQLMLEVYDYTELERILSGSLKRESDFNSSSKRIAYLLKRLIESTSPLLIDDLAEEAGVSRSTLNKDLKQVKSLAESYSITISGKPNRGLEVLGSELNLRLLYKWPLTLKERHSPRQHLLFWRRYSRSIKSRKKQRNSFERQFQLWWSVFMHLGC